MEKIKEYIKKEMEKYSNPNLNENNNKQDNSQKQLKEDFQYWIENLNRSMYDRKYRQVLSEIETGKQNFESIPSEHWKYKSIQLKAIFHIIQRKLIKYPFEISKENSPKNKSLLFWFNYSFMILEQLILQFRGDLNANLNLKSKNILKPIQNIFLGQINLLYLLIQYSYIYNQIPEICTYLSMVDRLINYSGYIVNIHTLPILQKLLLIRVKICLANCDYLNGMRYVYVKKTIDLCTDQLMYIIDFDLNLENIEEYAKDYRNPYKINKMNKKIIEEIFINISIAFYFRGVLSELLGNTTKAIDSYKQCKFFSTKFLKKKYYNFTMFFSALQNNGYLYLAVVDELKKLKEEKELKESIQKNYFMKKKYYDKIKYEKNYDKYYSTIRTKQDLYKGDLKKFLDSSHQILYKEEQNRYSVLKKFTKANYITSTMKMINNLLSKDFKSVLKRMDKVEVTKPSDEINSLINWTLIRQRQRQILFNSKNKKNLFKKKVQRANNSCSNIRNKMNKEDIGAKTVKNKKTCDISQNKSLKNIKKDKIDPISNIKYQKIIQRPLSSAHINNKNKKNYFNNQKTKTRASSNSKARTRANKSEVSSLETIDNDYSNKYYYLLENNNNNYSLMVKNNYLINNSSAIFLKGKSNKNQRNRNNSFEKKYISLNNYNYKKINNKMTMNKTNVKIKLKPRKEFRIDKDNFGKDYLLKKRFLDNYFNEEIKFHVKLLKTKSCELELTRERQDFDSKEVKRDAERTFNKIFEICKSSTNKKDIANYMKNTIRMNSKINSNANNSMNMDGNLTTINEKSSKIANNFYGFFDEDKKNDNNDRIIDAKEKKRILLNNEEKMKILNMEFEQMNQKENELKIKKKKLLEEVIRKKFLK